MAEPRASRDHRRRADLGAHAEPARRDRGADLRDDPALELAGVEQRSASRAASVSATAPPSSTPGTSVTKRIRSARIPTASAAAASSALTFSGPAAIGATTGISRWASASSTGSGRVGSGSPTRPSSGTGSARRPISSPSRPTARSPIASQRSAFTARASAGRARAPRGSSRAGRRRTRREPEALHLLGDLRPGAVHDADLVLVRELEDRGGAARRATAPPTLTTTLTSGSPR